MIKIITGAQMQELDRRTIDEARIPVTTLMERAGSGVASCIEHWVGTVSGKTITLVCGKGNNGGDGFVAARLLRRRHANVRVLAMSPIRFESGCRIDVATICKDGWQVLYLSL